MEGAWLPEQQQHQQQHSTGGTNCSCRPAPGGWSERTLKREDHMYDKHGCASGLNFIAALAFSTELAVPARACRPR
jgi:hypothetical protein